MPKKKIKKKKLKNKMDMENAQEILSRLNKQPKVKYVKTDNSLIERESLENEKVILTEDNRQVLFG